MTQPVALYESGNVLAVDVILPEVSVDIPEAPPVTGRNTGVCFGCAPVDEVRLAEVLEFLRKIGFVTQSVVVERDQSNYAMVSIKFGQVADRRITQ